MIAQLVEILIPCVSDLKGSIEQVNECYLKLPPLIEREHRAIKSSIFSEVQSICQEKEALTSSIEEGFEFLSKTVKEISRLLNLPLASVSEAVRVLKDTFDATALENSLAHQVLKHVIAGSVRASDELSSTIQRVKPIIESNRDLVTSLMQSYSQSYRFWQEIQEQVSSSYSSDGIQKTIGRVSGFRARA